MYVIVNLKKVDRFTLLVYGYSMTLSKEKMTEYQRKRRLARRLAKGESVPKEPPPDRWAEIFRRLDALEEKVNGNMNVNIDNERLKCPPIVSRETKLLKTKEDAVLAVKPLVEKKFAKPRGHAINCTCWSCRPPKF